MTIDHHSAPPIPGARYIMTGGFLGAGKTTAIAQLAQWLSNRGQRVGLITNDQGGNLVDTTLQHARGFAVEEIPGGCFCCRFNSLIEAARKLTAATRPDVFLAEPVGSCTDLVATVTYPLRKLYGDAYTIAPLSVLVDPIRAMRILGLASGRSFSPKVTYIYRKQLEEADVIVVNKCDLLDEPTLDRLRGALSKDYPNARLLAVSATHGTGLEEWFVHLTQATQTPRRCMPVDYDTYAEGEALLGWLNATLTLASPHEWDGNELVHQLAATIQKQLNDGGIEVAHLKMTLETRDGLSDLAVVNLVRSDFVPELAQNLAAPLSHGELTLNLRAEGSPETLEQIVRNSFTHCLRSHPDLTARWEHHEAFRPGRPEPVHRLESPG